MPGIYNQYAITIPTEWLVWLATSPARLAIYRLQSWHTPIRTLHLLATATFFGAIFLLDLRLLRLANPEIPPQTLARLVLPIVHTAFAILIATGAWLFLYDPIQTGSHTWFLPKLLLIAAGAANAAAFSRHPHQKIAAALSILLWTATIASATANQQERPQIPGRTINRLNPPTASPP